MKFVKLPKVSLKDDPALSEKWVQEQLAEDPSILGLGNLILRDVERPQPRAGRLDLLLQDPETDRRYEVEIQLGAVDESHIIRTIEYWDLERKRYPQYDHTAVIVAEEITSRFLNVISLFNGMIPLVAIQMAAYRVEGGVSLIFTTVLDQMVLGLVDDDDDAKEVADRGYWEKRSSPAVLSAVDRLVEIIQSVDRNLQPTYKKRYVGVARNGQPQNFVTLYPKKRRLAMTFKCARSEDFEKAIEEAGIGEAVYMEKHGRYRLPLDPGDVQPNADLLRRLIGETYEAWGS